VLLSGLAVTASNGEVDLAIRGMAPAHVDVGSTYVVNVSYANLGWVPAPDNWVQVTLPAGTQFDGAIYPGGEPRPPDEVDGNVLTWNVRPLVANSVWGHIMIYVQVDEGLAEGETLEVEAEIGGSSPESNTDNNTVTMSSTVYDMGGSMKRVRARHAMPADEVEYTITIDLPQQGAGRNRQWVTLTDTLPARHQARFLGWSGEVSGTLIEGHRLRWQGEVEAGEPVQLRYRLGVEGDVPPGTVLSNVAEIGWHGRQMQLGPVNTVVTVPHGAMGLGPGQGGQVQHRYGIMLDVPHGAVSDTTRFQLGPLTGTRPITPPGGLHFANRAFEVKAHRFGEPVGRFRAPLTITAHYSDTDVAGLRRETLRLWTRSGPGEPWEEVGEPVRSEPGTIAHTTTHLSEFALFGEPLDWGEVDLAVRAAAPVHVDVGSTYEVNVSYANLGWVPAPDSWVQVTLPAGTQFVKATYAGGEPRPPDEVEGNVLTWNLGPRVANSAWGHILVYVKVDEGLAEGETLSVLAEIGGSAPESDTDNNTATASSTVRDMGGAVKRVHARQAMPADALEYTITVDLPQQGGGGGPQWVTVTDTLPARDQARFLGWSGEVSGTLIAGHRLRWEGQVQPGNPVQLRYRLGVEGDVPPGTVLSNVAVMDWHGQQLQLGPVNAVVTVPHGVMGLGPGQGGEVEHHYGVTLTVPRRAVSDTVRFELGPRPEDAPPIVPPGGLQFANRAFEIVAYRFGEPVGQFQAPLTITLRYSETDVAGLRRETLRLWTRSGPEGPWAELGEPVRHVSGTIAHTTTHLSEFALFGEPEVPTGHRVYLPLIGR
jgi:hypothetical protein